MSLTTALEEQEKSPDKGWSYSCILSNSDSVSDSPASNTEAQQQKIAETPDNIVLTSPLEDSVEIESHREESQVGFDEVIGGQVTEGQGIDRGSIGTENQQQQWSHQQSEEGEVQIVENGGETVTTSTTVEDQPGLKFQGDITEKGQVVYRVVSNIGSGNQDAKALLEKLLSKGNYQQLANRVNSTTTAQSSASPQTIQGTILSQVHSGLPVNCAAGQPQTQVTGQLGAGSSLSLTPQNIRSILSDGKISKEDLLKLIKSNRAAGGFKARLSSPQQLQTQNINGVAGGLKARLSSPIQLQTQNINQAAGGLKARLSSPQQNIVPVHQATSPVTRNQQVLNPILFTGTGQKIGAVSLAKQAVAGSSIAELFQSKSNQGVVVSLTSANTVGSPQSSTDGSLLKVVHVATPTPVKQATTATNNEIISNLTLTNQPKVQTVGSPQNVTSGNQAVVIPSGTTQYIILNQGTPVQNINSPAVNKQQVPTVFNSPTTVPNIISGVRLAGQVTRPLRVVHSGPQANEVRALLASPRFSASQSPTKVVIPHNLSALTSIVDNASITSTQTVTIGIPTQTTVTSHMMSVGRGVMNKRQSKQTIGGRGSRQIRRNYFVDPASYQKASVSGTVSPGIESRVIQTSNTDVVKTVPLSHHVVIAGPQNSIRLLQSNAIKPPASGKNVKQTAKHGVMNQVEHGYSSPCQGNSSLVDYSDSDSLSNSSEKCESDTASDLPKSQNSEGQSFSNGKIVMPTELSNAIARAKPNEKILVDGKNYHVKFIKNVVYSININGQVKSYRYDGQYLVPSSDELSLVGGGIGDRKERMLRGNATGLHMSTPQGNSTAKTFLKTAEAAGKVFRDGRFWKHSVGPEKTATGMDTNSNEDSGESESTSQENNQGKKRPLEDVSDLPPVEDDEMRVVYCKFCGYTSTTVRSCERCHRTFPADTKIEIQKKKFKQDLEAQEGAPAISKQSFYGKPVSAPIVVHTAQVTNKAGNIMVLNYVNHGRRVNLDGKTYRSPSVIRGGKQSRKSYTVEPVTISISSDEEEEPEKSNVPGSTATGSIKSNVEDDIGELLDGIEQNKRSDSPTFQGGRMEKMEDEEGKPVIKRKNGRRKSPTRPPSRGSTVNNPPQESSDSAVIQKTEAVSHLDFNAKVIHIGSVLGCPIEPVVIAEDSISFYVECEEYTHRFIIKPDQLQQCLYCLENKPVIFLKTTAEFAEQTREMLKINTADNKNFFDPNDTVLKHQFISIVLLGMGSLTYPKLESVLNKYPKPEGVQFPFIVKMTGEQALVYLKEVQGEDCLSEPATPQPQERSPSPPKILFTGPVVKLITFPPPPAAGGIQVTNEDLSCLEEGEFLNDVIIDFYLKYLFLDVLSDRDRERTHIFSSFFFKRLTQRQGRCGLDDMADKTPAEKKHARVKNWTKKVDLFEKDFIFVPINEHSHWFLAVICFPGLMNVKRITYVPKSNVVTQLTMTVQTVSNPDPKLAEKGGSEKEPVKSLKALKDYKIPKLVKNGDSDNKIESKSESNISSGETKTTEEDNGQNGEGDVEPMETDENCLSDAQKQEIAEDSEEMMDTSVKQTEGDESQTSVEDQYVSHSQEVKKSVKQTEGDESQTSVGDQSASNSQEVKKSESKTEIVNQNKTTKVHLRAQVKDLRGRDLTETELKDPKTLHSCATGSRQPCILVFDSLAGQNRSRIVSILKDYLQVEWDTKKKTPNILKERIRGCTATKVPQQTNFSDCGVYVLQYVESFFEDPIQDFSIPLKPLVDWFTEERVTAKRNEIKELVMRLKDIQQKDKS